ncbi:MAG: hypothetical protein Q8R91_03130 [Candidatus Omnitrophota bacterium]|nr:hypothetical protein [Candidatus Omnitrophota bacterium]
MVVSGALTIAVALPIDLYLHRRFERAGGLNIRSYRGALVGRKQAEEQRVVVLGGSAAFGYGVRSHEALPAALERQLNIQRRHEGRGPVSVANLAYNREGAYALLPTLKDYEFLDYDLALFYTGYNDLNEEPNVNVFRQESLMFKLTGYYPILPLVVREKWMTLRHGGNLEAAYRAQAVVFRPGVGNQANPEVHKTADEIRAALEHQVGHVTHPDAVASFAVSDCGQRWAHYCESVAVAVEYALGRGKGVLVVTEPYLSDEHVVQQAAMANMLNARFSSEPRLRYVNLGRNLVDLKDPTLCLDGMHLSATGNERMAAALVEPVLELLDDAQR